MIPKRIKTYLFLLTLSFLSCEKEDFMDECGAHGGTFRFNILNKESGEDLFFGENSPYHEGELLIYIISSLPLSNDPSDTIFHYSVRGINSDKGCIFTTFYRPLM